MTWHEVLAWVLVGAEAATIVALLLRKPRVEAPPARPPLAPIPDEATKAKREEERRAIDAADNAAVLERARARFGGEG